MEGPDGRIWKRGKNLKGVLNEWTDQRSGEKVFEDPTIPEQTKGSAVETGAFVLATGNANVSDDAQAEIEALEVEVECGLITMEEYEQKKAALLQQEQATPVQDTCQWGYLASRGYLTINETQVESARAVDPLRVSRSSSAERIAMHRASMSEDDVRLAQRLQEEEDRRYALSLRGITTHDPYQDNITSTWYYQDNIARNIATQAADVSRTSSADLMQHLTQHKRFDCKTAAQLEKWLEAKELCRSLVPFPSEHLTPSGGLQSRWTSNKVVEQVLLSAWNARLNATQVGPVASLVTPQTAAQMASISDRDRAVEIMKCLSVALRLAQTSMTLRLAMFEGCETWWQMPLQTFCTEVASTMKQLPGIRGTGRMPVVAQYAACDTDMARVHMALGAPPLAAGERSGQTALCLPMRLGICRWWKSC